MTYKTMIDLPGQVKQVEPEKRHLLLCGGVPCVSLGCQKVRDAVSQELEANGYKDKIKMLETGCIGNCTLGPSLIIYPEGVIYQHLTPENAREIVEEHILQGHLVEHLLYRDHKSRELQHRKEDMPFYQKQKRLVLRHCGVIPPHLDPYMASRGYAALIKALTEMKPNEVLVEVEKSGLRGRGGGGFPTGRKWQSARQEQNPEKYVICNADEGDPGAFMDRSILEGDPHAVLEGLILAGYAVGAKQGYIYVRAEYPLAIKRTEDAIREAQQANLLGSNILDQGFNFNLEVRVGAGAFVCGEETALITSIEGTRGDPGPRPPFPVQKGLWGRPTVINNVETLANIPLIVLMGGEEFAKIGTETSKGTKVFALAGNVRHTGLVEVPMGTTLRTIIFDIAGGVPEEKTFKAAQTGGPAGGCLGLEHLDLPLDYDALRSAGCTIGSGGLIVMDEDTCMVDVARYFSEFNQQESCGKCTPCRVGSKRMLEILQEITGGRGTQDDLGRLEELAILMKNASLCGLGRSAPNPVLSTLRHFKEEYLVHIRDKRCPAGACADLQGLHINEEKCKACGLCAGLCPVDAINSQDDFYRIDPNKCIDCQRCLRECPFEAIVGSRPGKKKQGAGA